MAIERQELTKFTLKMVAALRGASEGIISIPQYKGWTKEEMEGVANLLLEDLREGRTAELEKLYEETSGDPFKEVKYP